ncbi:hypothetical protein KI688_003647 [Linnemannia hyalina]|uniref:Uncharacterized protein n=1 Tax=Linnemannia hyalina TaxID=64524 RepID=A0A9P7XP29_9FUNG|nr:hypothetical protein KI688_003647 [Linnemannia hyalina]
MPSTASTETASSSGASLTPASAAVVAGSIKDGSVGGSDASTVDSSVSSSASVSSGSSMTSVSPSSVTEHSHSYSEMDSTVSGGELRDSDSRRREKEEGRKALSIDGVVTGSLTPQTQQPSSSSKSSSQQYLAHATTTIAEYQQQQQQQQEDQVAQDQQNPLELCRKGLPPTSTDHIHLHPNQEEQHLYLGPRVCKMVMKHSSVKLDWKVPEPIKAGGEVLRGVLVITAKELLENEVKAAVKSKSRSGGGGKKGKGGGKKKKVKQDRAVWVEHIEIDLTGLEVLPIEELKCILDTSSFSSSFSSSSTSASSSTSHTATSSSQLGSSSTCGPIPRRSSSLMHSSSSLAETDLPQPGRLPPGTQQGISFQMRIPERVGGTYRNAHASISYQLTANVHIRRGKEMFVLQHPLPLSLFELVQIRAATKITSPHDLNPSTSINNKAMITTTASASSSITSGTSSVSSAAAAGGVKRQAGVRFVIPKANSVLGTAAVKPYSLWGLGPATSSSSSSSHHGHGHHGHNYRRQSSHQRRGSLSAPPPSSAASSVGGSTSLSAHQAGPGMTRSYSDIGALSSRSMVDLVCASGAGSLSGDASVSVKKARFDPDEMLSAEDQYRSRQVKQQQQQQYQQELDLQQQGSTGGSRPKLGSRKGSTDELDEVGFGANIDKSVAAAGENVTMDMFVVKSDMMKVVDIKVSLVETIQIFSLLDYYGACDVVSPIAGRAHVFDNNTHQHSGAAAEAGSGAGSGSKRKLVETHMVKIAKAYVPAQAEESHANDNHLKGYYEDYEDARTTKSLSMYKLGMRIPETALTIQDRDLLKVEYMFVIKFFFKGRMGAFLELPIEIVSQYNHNRISTISGAISCVSNSVQIAMPPVPILVKRHGSVASSSIAAAKVVEVVKEGEAAKEDVKGEAIEASATYYPESGSHGQTRDDEGREEGVKESQSAEEILASPIIRQDAKEVTTTESSPSSRATSASLRSTSQSFDSSSQDTSSSIDKSSTAAEEQVDRACQLQGPTPRKDSTASMDDIAEAQKTEEEGILASSRLSKAEFAACTSRQVGLAVARYNQMSSIETASSTTIAAESGSGKDLKRAISKPTSAAGAEGVPKIVIECVNTKSRSGGPASSSSISTSRSNSTTTTTMTTTTVVSPALPILFDLTSAALPTPAPSTVSPPIPSPLVTPQSTGGSNGPTPMSVTPGVRSSSMGAESIATSSPVADSIKNSNSFPRSARDTESQLPKLLPLLQATNTSVYSSSSREDDHHHHYYHHSEAEGNKSTTSGLVAKIAKSLSSPLLRTRTGTNSSNISPNGSQSTLPLLSPQHQQSSAFTLAATTLSALTLLSAVGQAAVSSEGKKAPQPAPRPLKSCIKKRSSVRPPGLNTGNLTASGGGGQHSRSATSSQGQGQGHPYNAMGTNTNRKKVTFAKGLTPVPSPTGSQVLLSDPIVLEPFKYKNQNLYPNTTAGSSSASSSSSSASSSLSPATGAATVNRLNPVQGLSTSLRTNPGIAAAALITVSARPIVLTPHHPHHQHQFVPAMTTTTAPIWAQAPAGPTMSPNNASSRTRIHHPFDSHPSRLSPLEKKHLDFQVQIQDLKPSSLHGRITASKDFSSKSVTDNGNEDDEEEAEDDEEEGEGEEEEEYEEEEDENEDDQETEEERIERRKQARIAWLAKYGDAFKQVYGAVPELPPL